MSGMSMIERLEMAVKYCSQCSVWYTEIGNLGTWECSFHPLDFNRDEAGPNHKKGRWECCGRASLQNGCVPADHRAATTHWTENDYIQVDIDTAMQLGVPLDTIRALPENINTQETMQLQDGSMAAVVVVPRYNPTSYNSHRYYSIPPSGYDHQLQASVRYATVPGRGLSVVVTPE